VVHVNVAIPKRLTPEQAAALAEFARLLGDDTPQTRSRRPDRGAAGRKSIFGKLRSTDG
jgi:DnaJ-class molecular chaperone